MEKSEFQSDTKIRLGFSFDFWKSEPLFRDFPPQKRENFFEEFQNFFEESENYFE